MSNRQSLSASEVEMAIQQQMIAEFEALKVMLETERAREEARYARMLLEAQARETMQYAMRQVASMTVDLTQLRTLSTLDWDGFHRTKH